jgi:predicted secreted hydrolase
MDLTVDDWSMLGQDGDDRLRATMPGYAIDLQLTSRKPPALHDGDGYIDYGDGTASYYYSRTDLNVTGRLEANGATIPVTGVAWMDHQWGNFKTFESGGWDWFALDLNDDRQIMLYLIRNERRDVVLVDGSIVAPDGALTALGASDFTVEPLGTWTSPATDTTYPSGWRIDVPRERLRLTVVPTMLDQELDTRASTGVIYWEGEATVTGMAAGRPVDGLAYVELTGYAPVVAAGGVATPGP